jgi:hypothetical protein
MHGFRNLDQLFLADPCCIFRKIERERLKALLEFVEVVDLLGDEILSFPSLVNYIFRNGGQPDQVCSRFWPQEYISPARHFVLPEI